MAEEKKQSFLKGAAILSMATIAVKLVGLFFSIPLANLIGEQAMNYYGSAYEMFALFNAAATAGLPVAVSRMVSEAYTVGKKKQADRVFIVAVTSFSLLGLICSLLMFLFAEQLAVFLNVPGAKYSIQALAPTVFFCAFMSAIRGYFQGRSNMVPTAISQVIEAVSKLAIGLSLAYYVHAAWKDGELSSAAAVLGVSVSALLGAVFSAFYKLHQRKRDRRSMKRGEGGSTSSYKSTLGTLMKLSVPITVGACFVHLLNLYDVGIVNGSLKGIDGFSEDYAEALYGTWLNTVKIYDLPGAIIIPLSTSVLPILTAAFTRGDKAGVRKTAASVLRMTFIIAIPCFVGLAVFARPIASAFYTKQMSIDGVGMLLPIVAVSVVFNGLLYTTNAIIQSMGNMRRPVVHMAIGGAVKIILNYTLVPLPWLNIRGVAISTVASNLIVAVLNLIFISKLIPQMEGVFSMVIPIIPAALLMGGGSYLSYMGFTRLLTYMGMAQRIPMTIALLLAIVIAVIIYLVTALLFKAIRPNEIKMMPKGDLIVKKLRLKESGRHFK